MSLKDKFPFIEVFDVGFDIVIDFKNIPINELMFSVEALDELSFESDFIIKNLICYRLIIIDVVLEFESSNIDKMYYITNGEKYYNSITIKNKSHINKLYLKFNDTDAVELKPSCTINQSYGFYKEGIDHKKPIDDYKKPIISDYVALHVM